MKNACDDFFISALATSCRDNCIVKCLRSSFVQFEGVSMNETFGFELELLNMSPYTGVYVHEYC